MKLLSFKENNQTLTGVLDSTQTYVKTVSSILGTERFNDMNYLLEHLSKDQHQQLDNYAKTASGGKNNEYKLEGITLLAPVPHPKHDIICMGLNYSAHVKEFDGGEIPQFPVVFSKRAAKTAGHRGKVDGHIDVDDQLDYEAELAVIIGSRCYKATRDTAEQYIFGYTILNDYSSRLLQQRHQQWYLGKSADTFTAFGPWIVTKDEFKSNPTFDICSLINGELRQNSNTENFIFKIPEIIELISGHITLEPGDIIATGTPSGVGKGFKPPRYLKKGDLVTCKIEGLGELTNTII